MQRQTLSYTPDELASVLAALFQPNTETVKQATATLRQYFKQVQALENLLVLMASSSD